MRLSWLLLMLNLFLVLSAAQAQTLHFGLSAPLLEPEIILEDLELSDTRIDLRLAYQETLEFGVSMSQTTSLGPVGNVALLGQADVATSGHYQVSLAAEGVIGSVAASLEGKLFKGLPGIFSLHEAFENTRPRYKAGSSLDIGLSYRLSRNQVISAYPSFYFLPEGFATKLEADYKLYKLFEPHDGSFLLQAYVSPEQKTYAALGFQFDLNDKDLPSIAASAWLSLGHQGFLPGLKASLSQSFKPIEGKLSLSLGLEPYRSDFIPYYLQASYTQALGSGVLEANLYTALGTRELAPITLKVGYGYRF
jgi:hypothetical protein